MRKRILSLSTIICCLLVLNSCSLFRVHKLNIQQGNLVTYQQVKKLHVGMTRKQVEAVLGEPILSNLFDRNEMLYIYTWQPAYGKLNQLHLIIKLKDNHLVSYSTNIKPDAQQLYNSQLDQLAKEDD